MGNGLLEAVGLRVLLSRAVGGRATLPRERTKGGNDHLQHSFSVGRVRGLFCWCHHDHGNVCQ